MRIAKLSLALALSFTFTFSLWNIIICVHEKFFNELEAVDTWLEENNLGQYRKLFRDLGEYFDDGYISSKQYYLFKTCHLLVLVYT